MRNLTFLMILLLSACSSKDLSNKKTNSEHRFVFSTKLDKEKKHFFLESQFSSDRLRKGCFDEITWIMLNTESIYDFFVNKSVPLNYNKLNVDFGSYLISDSIELIHCKLDDGRSGWINDSIPIDNHYREFLSQFLDSLIEETKEIHTNYCSDCLFNGFITMTHFNGDNNFVFIEYYPLMIDKGQKIISYHIGYIYNIKEMSFTKRNITSTMSMGMHHDSNYVFVVQRDPWGFKAINMEGQELKKEGIYE